MSELFLHGAAIEKRIAPDFELEGAKRVNYFLKQGLGLVASATRGGIKFEGPIILDSSKELEEFAKLVSDCWTEHQKLKIKLVSTLSGH